MATALRNEIFTRRGECGAVAVLLSLGALVVLMTVALTAINLGFAKVGVVELQRAAESAAAAGTAQLCGSRACYAKAREVALAVAASHQATSSLGVSRFLAPFPPEASGYPDDQYIFTGENLKITIERGVKRSDGSFEAMEGSWPAAHPGVPTFLAANSVRVTIQRPNTSIFSGSFFGESFVLERYATAIKGGTYELEVSPFALQACTLLDNGDADSKNEERYSSTGLCQADRYFTRTDRYQTAAFNSAAAVPTIPGFPWQGCDVELAQEWASGMSLFQSNVNISFRGNSTPLNGEGGYGACLQVHGSGTMTRSVVSFSPPSSRVNRYSLGNVQFAGKWRFPQNLGWARTRTDHFGVVGVPGLLNSDDLASDQTELEQLILSKTDLDTFPAKLGDSFAVLPKGFTAPSLDSKIWERIKLPGGTPLRSTALRSFERTFGAFETLANLIVPATPASSFVPQWTRQDCTLYCRVNTCQSPSPSCTFYHQNDVDKGRLLDYDGDWLVWGNNPTEGLCNSKWARITDYNTDEIYTGDRNSFYMYRTQVSARVEKTADLNDNSPVWRVKMPIIADWSVNAKPCLSVPISGLQPIDPAVEPSAASQYRVIGFVEGFVYDVDIGQPPPTAEWDFTVPSSGRKVRHRIPLWGYHRGDPEVPGCNLVRARVDCREGRPAYFFPSNPEDDVGAQTVRISD